MNHDNLHELINRYESNIDMLYGAESYELFKWCALKCWQEEWNKPAGSFSSFADRFSAARREFSIFIDNSRMHPSNGIVKLCEREPEKVETLFCDVLFAPDGGNISKRQDNMDAFLAGYETLRQQYYPGNWSFKQDRHSASVFLAMNAPADNYVFKSSEALTMAKYVDFGLTIGAGASFSLENYYSLCDSIVDTLKEHKILLEKHFARLTERHYIDKSLHMLAFDLMYCCRTYGFYKGLTVPSTGKTIKRHTVATPSAEELARMEAERQEKMLLLEQEILELEQTCDICEDISLLGVQVSSNQYGTGTVIEQNKNVIKVQFQDEIKSFVLDKKYVNRPRFENDDVIIETFSQYAQAVKRIESLKKQLTTLQAGTVG